MAPLLLNRLKQTPSSIVNSLQLGGQDALQTQMLQTSMLAVVMSNTIFKGLMLSGAARARELRCGKDLKFPPGWGAELVLPLAWETRGQAVSSRLGLKPTGSREPVYRSSGNCVHLLLVWLVTVHFPSTADVASESGQSYYWKWMSQNNMWCTLNLCNVVCQIYSIKRKNLNRLHIEITPDFL